MYLGIDIGTSAVKAVLMDGANRLVGSESAPLTVDSPHPGWSEQNPQDWWTATIAACSTLRSSHPNDYSQTRAIGLSGQMHGATLLGADHRVLRSAILWNDGRSAAQCRTMSERMADIGDLAGVPPMPGFTAPKIVWVKENEPEVHGAIAHILLPKDFVRLKLTGTLATDMSDAAGTLWLDEAKRVWSDRLCEVSDTDPAWLPALHEGSEASGELTADAASELGLPTGLPVAAGGGDAATGAVGIGAVGESDAFLSLGTSGQFFVSDDRYSPNPASLVHAFAHAVPDRWFRMAVMLNGASPLAWHAGIMDAPIPDLLEETKNVRDDRIPLFLPYLTGERSPHNDPKIRGAFYGLDGSTTRGEMTRAVLDAVAYCFADARDSLVAAGSAPDRAMAIGGGTRSDLVLQTLADALDIELDRPSGSEAGPAVGAAKLAAMMMGEFSLDDLAAKPPIGATFRPDPSRAAYHRERHKRYKGLYQALKPFAAA